MKKGMARGRGNAKKRVADMALPPGQRARRRKGKGRGAKGAVAQMDHANNSEANKQRRAFERRESRAREDKPPNQAAVQSARAQRVWTGKHRLSMSRWRPPPLVAIGPGNQANHQEADPLAARR